MELWKYYVPVLLCGVFLEPLIVSGRLNPGTLQKEPCRVLGTDLWCVIHGLFFSPPWQAC